MTQGNTKNSMSSLLAQFLTIQSNSLSIINSLNTASTTKENTVEVQWIDERGIPEIKTIQSASSFNNRLDNLESSIKSLAGLDSSTSAVVRNPDGTYSKIFQTVLAKDPAPITGINPPAKFIAKNNWFFENFLTPQLFITLPVGNQVPFSTNRVYVKRIILNPDTIDKKNYFDLTYKDKSNIDHDTFLNDLTLKGISYFVDEGDSLIPSQTYRFTGNFDVVNISDSTSMGKNIKQFFLNSILYNDTLSNTTNSVSLIVGDRVSTPGGTRYKITNVNASENYIEVLRESGLEPISLGSSMLSIVSPVVGNRELDISIGYDEREVIFLKTIDDRFNIIGTSWSKGIGFYTNTLEINTSAGVLTLEDFYVNEVADIGKQFLNQAKEKIVHSVDAIKPNTPVINTSNFSVVQTNSQVTNSPTLDSIKNKTSQKDQLTSDMNQIDVQLSDLRSKLSVSSVPNPGETDNLSILTLTTQQIQSQISQLTAEREKKSALFSSIVSEITALQVSTPQMKESPKYSVRGFFDIPSPKYSASTGYQEIIQFIIKHRVLSKDGDAGNTQQISYIDKNSKKVTGSFSNWIETKSQIRKKIYDSAKGTYVWDNEDISNPDINNINQVDIPISQGQQIEIQIIAVSEAGWPYNPSISDPSSSVVISFPDNLTSNNSSEIFLNKNQEDSTIVTVEKQFSNKGVDQHLTTQFSYGSKTYAHNAGSIASGFYADDGSPLDVFEKISELQKEIQTLKGLIGTIRGTMEAYLIDPSGNSQKIGNTSLLKVLAPFYNQVYTNPADYGKIVTVQYQLQILNTVATPLELASISPGGLSTRVSNTQNVENYSTNFRYNSTPVSFTGLTSNDITSLDDYIQAPPFASGSSNSQFIYNRFKTVGWDKDLYFERGATGTENYNYTGTLGEPRNGDILIPYLPSSSGSTHVNVWNGLYTSGQPQGNGTITEFCIDITHPSLNGSSIGASFIDLVKPSQSGGLTYPAFRHTRYFERSTADNEYYKQLSLTNTLTGFNGSNKQDYMYPDKLGFSSNDRYLVGKYSCGAYLFMGPATNGLVQVEGSTSLAKKSINEGVKNALNIPIIFQFRAQDKLGYVGGYRSTGDINNITYTKRVGFDIKLYGMEQFSFDIEMTGKFLNDQPVFSQQTIITSGNTSIKG